VAKSRAQQLQTAAGLKQMRCVIILSAIARTFAEHLFQPTYFLRADSSIDKLLTRQAQENSSKGSAFRALLQALLLYEQEGVVSDRIAQVCTAIMELVQGLLPFGEETEFRDHIRGLAEEACEAWADICRYRDAVLFEEWSDNDLDWHELHFQANKAFVRQATNTSAREDEALFAIFLCLCG
jgi:hypothetical protein